MGHIFHFSLAPVHFESSPRLAWIAGAFILQQLLLLHVKFYTTCSV
jgi:hypothetical protein